MDTYLMEFKNYYMPRKIQFSDDAKIKENVFSLSFILI